MTDTLQLGQIIDEGRVWIGEAQRDAIHVAVVPVRAREDLDVGAPVRLTQGTADFIERSTVPQSIGIVDPFLTVPVRKGQWCWLFLKPGSITSLRHDWVHPAFEDIGQRTFVPPVTTSERDPLGTHRKWMEKFATNSVDESYDDVMSHAKEFLEFGDYWCEGGRFEGLRFPDEFWEHYSALTGETVEDDKGTFFTCSCG